MAGNTKVTAFEQRASSLHAQTITLSNPQRHMDLTLKALITFTDTPWEGGSFGWVVTTEYGSQQARLTYFLPVNFE